MRRKTLDEFMVLMSNKPDTWYLYQPDETQAYFIELMEQHEVAALRFLDILDLVLVLGEEFGENYNHLRAMWHRLTGEEWINEDKL